MAYCLTCKRLLDHATDPLSLDCGGDCWGCVSEAEVARTTVDLEAYRKDPTRFWEVLNQGSKT